MSDKESKTTANTKTPRYKDPDCPVEERIDDLLSRMTDAEMVRQMDQYFGASFLVDKIHPKQHTCMADDAQLQMDRMRETIGADGVGCIHDLYPNSAEVTNRLQKFALEETRLGIPILFSEEALHGLQRPGCSVFPQSIALAATWNPDIVRRVGAAIAAETRAYGIHEAFGPVIDLVRDPRWGRVEETYGEDTHLAGRMAAAMVRGMQGSDLKSDTSIVAEPKHFFGYGASASGLNCGPCFLSRRELEAYYLPVFEAAIAEAGAWNVMCSYNSIDGEPCASSRELLTEVLRDKWGLRGFVRSDLGAVWMLEGDHFTAPDTADAIRQSVEAGLDMQYYDYKHDIFQGALLEMLEKGTIQREAVERAVRSVLRVKFALGLFENPYTDPKRVADVVRCAEHGALALDTARQCIGLLKNEDNLLPLAKDLKRIAVIGPSADTIRLGDYTTFIEGFEPVTLLQGIRSTISADTEILYAQGTGILENELESIPEEFLFQPDGAEPGLRGEYFDSPDCTGEPVLVRADNRIDFNWILAKPCGEIGAKHFSVRWQGVLKPDRNFQGFLGTSSQDSMRLWVNDELLVDGWGAEQSAKQSAAFAFEAGREYTIRVEYSRDTNGAQILLGWNRGAAAIGEAVEIARRAEVTIVSLGDSTETCGENLDRSDLNLPGRQLELLQAVHATGTPVVLVLQNGRPMTLTWETEHIPSILEAWYAGEQGGLAMAEALFGDIDPAGRIPMTFPQSVGQLPLYYNRRRGGARKFSDRPFLPLFAFGHGLSYTTFAYENMRLSSDRIAADAFCQVEFEVRNTGTRTGEEVVQLYIHDKVASVVPAFQELRHFERLRLAPGESRTLRFELCPRDLSILDKNLEWTVEPGDFEIRVGGSSDRIELREVLTVL